MTIDDVIAMHPDDERLRRVHGLYRDVIDAIARGVAGLRELGEERSAGALESWGRGVKKHAELHIQRMLRKDQRP